MYQVKALCLLISVDQKRCSFLFKNLRERGNMVRDEYLVTITLALDIFICTEGGVRGNQQSTRENNGGGGLHLQKVCMGHTFSQKRQRGTK